MRWASAISHRPNAALAFGEAAGALEDRLGGARPDLLLAFVSSDLLDGLGRIPDLAARRFPGALLAGCTGSGVIGDAHEAEEGPALSLTGASLPGVTLSPFRIAADSGEAGEPWPELVGVAPEARPNFLLLADPFTADVGAVLDGLDRTYPGAPKFGGLASGGRGAADVRLLLGKDVVRGGAVGVALRGDLVVDTLVAQGCRPIGPPMLVTRCKQMLLQGLDARPPLEVLGELFESLDTRDRELLRTSLFLGLEMRAESVEHRPGELLVRNILAIDEDSGALAIGAALRPMMVAQFVVRDPHSAEQELRNMLVRHRREVGRPAGALLFSCVGRGAGLFGHADHDTGLFEEQLGPAPLGGFFCNGEIGPVGGTTFLHGYTSSFAMFRPA